MFDGVHQTGNPEVDDFLSTLPIILPEGTDLNITTIKIKLCSGMKEEITSLTTQLHNVQLSNSQLGERARGLTREVTQLKRRLDFCSAAASSVSSSYQSQLQIRMNQLLQMSDSEAFQVLKFMSLVREIDVFHKGVEHAANSTKSPSEVTVLQKKLEEKIAELNATKQQIETYPNSALVLQIISLQSQIWDEQAESRLNTKRSQDLQEHLDWKFSELRGSEDPITTVLEMVSVHSKITTMQEAIRVHVEESRAHTDEIRRQRRNMVELLKLKILQLNEDENNKQLTKDILTLQGEVERLAALMRTDQDTLDTKLREARVSLDAEKKREEVLQRRLQDADYVQAQLMVKIISMMDELGELSLLTSTGETQDILTQLQAYKQDFTKAQTEIKDLRDKLHQTQEDCSGPAQTYESVKVKLEQKISELNRTEDAALILSVLALRGDLATLRKQISTSGDADMTSKLQKLQQEKQKLLDLKTADVERLITEPQTVLKVIVLLSDLQDLHNEDRSNNREEIRELEARLAGLLSELDDESTVSTKQLIQILTFQSQVEYLQRQLSNAGMLSNGSVIELRHELTSKETKLKQHVRELQEKDQTKANLILSITDLQHQLRKMDKDKRSEDKTASATVAELREQLTLKEKERQRDQALIKVLQNSVNQSHVHCSEHEQKIEVLQNDLDAKLGELKSNSDTVTALALKVSTLTFQLEELRQQLQNSPPTSKLKDLQKIIDAKNQELETKTEELKQRSSQAQRLLHIIMLQVQIEKLANEAANDTDYAKIAALQDDLTKLIDGIENENNETTKLTFQILFQQDEIRRLKNQHESQLREHHKKIKDLEDELEHIRSQIKEKTRILSLGDVRVANLSAEIIELHMKIKPLSDELSTLKETFAENLAELQDRLNLTKKQLQDCELQLQEADAKNFKLTMVVTDLRLQLKKAYQEASRAAKKSIADLEEQLETQQDKNRKLESTTRGLQQQVEHLEICCTVNTRCEDVQNKLKESQEDVDRLHQQLQEKDAALQQLQENLSNLQKKLGDVEDQIIHPSSVTMDPDTAHPRIILSAGNTEISTTDSVQGVPDHPGRFNVSLAVLGTTGFSSGRHYWEVSVVRKTCYQIGMASESAPRKGSLLLKPSNGFWTVVLNKQGQLKAIDRRPVDVSSEAQPLSLGVLLDYSKGQVSFYNPGHRSHMYTFSGQRFTDKIYPFINYCVEDVEIQSPIVLVPPGATDWIK